MTLWQVFLCLTAGGALLVPILRGREEDYSLEPIGHKEDATSAAVRRAAALEALRDIEFEHATGKTSDLDYESVRSHYVALAAKALREIETAHADEVARIEQKVSGRKRELASGPKEKRAKKG